jgi:hypothetical protein
LGIRRGSAIARPKWKCKSGIYGALIGSEMRINRPQSVIIRNANFFIGVGMFTIPLTLLMDLVFLGIFVRIIDLPIVEIFYSTFLYPLISSIIGFFISFLTKETTKQDVNYAKQNQIAKQIMYLNLVIFVINFFTLFGFGYFFAQMMA